MPQAYDFHDNFVGKALALAKWPQYSWQIYITVGDRERSRFEDSEMTIFRISLQTYSFSHWIGSISIFVSL